MSVLDPVRTRPRAFWADVRFLLGILLIVVSVAGVWFVVSVSRQTAPVFAAAHTIVPGQPITADDLRIVDVALGQVGSSYLTPESLRATAAADADGAMTDGSALIAMRTVREGELIPHSAVGAATAARVTTVVLHSATDVPASVAAGSVVEIWSAPLLERGRYDTPRILVADATVVSVTRDDSMIGGGSAALELVIPRADVASALSAVADQAALSVVPAGGSKP